MNRKEISNRSHKTAKCRRLYWRYNRDCIGDQCFFCSPRIAWATEETLISNTISFMSFETSPKYPLSWTFVESSGYLCLLNLQYNLLLSNTFTMSEMNIYFIRRKGRRVSIQSSHLSIACMVQYYL